MEDRGNQVLSEEIRDVRQLLETNMGNQLIHVSQQAKIHWLKMGEETSSMFFRRCKVCKAHSTLLRLIDDKGRALKEPVEIRDHIVDFYESLLSTEEIVSDLQFLKGQVVSAEEMGDLLCSPSEEDIK